MSVKTIYIVRHGESLGNISEYKAGLDPDLTKNGEEQALSVAERFVGVPVEVIISSPLIRARKTGERIAEKIDASVIIDEMVTEWRIPEKMIGVLKSDCPSMVEMINDDFAAHGIFPGGESFSEIKNRALMVMKTLESRPENIILIASHDVFLHVFVACVLFNESLTHSDFSLLYERMKASNTGITILNFNKERTRNPWTLLTWNDSTHI